MSAGNRNAHLSRMISASISARGYMGISRNRASTTSGLSDLTAEEITTTSALPKFSPRCPIEMSMPRSRSL